MRMRSSVRSGVPTLGAPVCKLTAEREMGGFVAGMHASKGLNTVRRNLLRRSRPADTIACDQPSPGDRDQPRGMTGAVGLIRESARLHSFSTEVGQCLDGGYHAQDRRRAEAVRRRQFETQDRDGYDRPGLMPSIAVKRRQLHHPEARPTIGDFAVGRLARKLAMEGPPISVDPYRCEAESAPNPATIRNSTLLLPAIAKMLPCSIRACPKILPAPWIARSHYNILKSYGNSVSEDRLSLQFLKISLQIGKCR